MKRFAKIGVVVVMAAIVLIQGYGQYQQQCMAEGIAGKIIRFHVRANSDTSIDQELKRKVRDAIGAYMQPRLSGITDVAESRRVIEDSLGQIEMQAQKALAEEGYHYPVEASLTITDFPEKTYGSYTFAAGKYEALEVVIGKGKGQNWWCVMYPNMCFFNSVYEVVDKEAEESLEHVLTKEEYKSLMEQKNYKVTSALFEWLEGKLQNIFCKH